jgi:hypothetical protein
VRANSSATVPPSDQPRSASGCSSSAVARSSALASAPRSYVRWARMRHGPAGRRRARDGAARARARAARTRRRASRTRG